MFHARDSSAEASATARARNGRGVIRTPVRGGVSRSAREETAFKQRGRELVARVAERGRGGRFDQSVGLTSVEFT